MAKTGNTKLLHHQAVISPVGRLHLMASDPGDASFEASHVIPLSLLKALSKAFLDSSSQGLTVLASTKCDQPLPASIQYWRRFATQYFQSLCRQPAPSNFGLADWNGPQPPSDSALQEAIDQAPPMRGLEYVTVHLLRTMWKDLDQHTCQQIQESQGELAGYLHALRPNWNLLGRVTFHLAENKKNPERPFAFLATFTRGKTASSSGRSSSNRSAVIEHVPLSEALRESVEAKDARQLDVLLEPVSRAAEACPLMEQLLESRALFTPQAWGIRQAFEFLSSVPVIEEAGVIVRVPNWWNASKPPRPQVQIKVGSKKQSTLGAGEGLDLKVGVAIDGDPLTKKEIADLMAAREGMTLLRGKWVQVDQGQLQSALDQWKELQKQHVSGLGFLEGLRLLSGAAFDGDDGDQELQSWTRLEPGPWLKETLDTLRDPHGKISLDPGQHLQATLRPYQADGVRWMWFATQLGLGVCLADDMGLGKTIQVISLLLQLKFSDLENTTPSLLIVPTSLLGNWQREVERFAPDLKLLIAHRSTSTSAALKRIAADPDGELAGYDLVVTTYGLARREKWLAEKQWRMAILDEAQAIKNAGAAQTKAIKAIPSQGRILLTGTPVENHLGDLWSLFDFCSPGLLGSAKEFKKFVKADDEKQLSRRLAAVRQLIRPYVLRRMKTDPHIAPDLPAKTEMRVDCGLTTVQATLYQKVTDELAQSLDLASGIQRRGMVLSALMQLKQICNHPSLYLKQADFAGKTSGKHAELKSICQTLIEKQEKLLVFSQFQSMCQPLADWLAEIFGCKGVVLTGKTPPARRGKLVKTFQQDSGPPFFVISVKAGGTGLNLTQASHVVHFDRWWNPAVEDQATDRAFRIGQKRNVIVHKFVCRGTLEDKIDAMIESKKSVSRELLNDTDEVQLTEMTNDQLLDFVALDLRKSSTT